MNLKCIEQQPSPVNPHTLIVGVGEDAIGQAAGSKPWAVKIPRKCPVAHFMIHSSLVMSCCGRSDTGYASMRLPWSRSRITESSDLVKNIKLLRVRLACSPGAGTR
jgi:hypothetical protein